MGRGRARFGGARFFLRVSRLAPEGAFLGTFFLTFSARFLARGFLGFPGVPYLFLQVFSKFFSGFFRVYKVRFFFSRFFFLRFP